MSAGHEDSGLRRGRHKLLPAAVTARLQMLADAVGIWAERFRTRRRLNHLSDHMLEDIGVSRTDMAREAEKPFWRK